ncbi:MAG: amidohydrolase family protein [Prevotellaceae bacterium]|nr:amidohydrolase family protein [Candidatus Faecinaster equi]
MKCYHGDIVTVNNKNEVFSYLVEDNGNIVFVGNDLPSEYANCEKVELGEKALIPAFVDTHQHFASFATFFAGLNVMEVTSNVEMKEEIKKFVARSNQKTLVAFGASPYSVKEGVLISREELDEVCPDKDILVVKYDGHACIINTSLLNKINDQIKDLRGYHPDTGEMNQEAFFKCSDYISNSVAIPALIQNMYDAVDNYAKHGIGEVHTVSGVGFPLNADITLEKLFAKALDNGFQLRVFPQSLNTKVATSRKLPRIGGCFECALDGCFGSHDAALNEGYTDDPSDKGVLYYSDEKVTEFCKKANRLGLQIELHAIGDRAFDQATRCLKAALDDYPRENHRHGIIHCCLPTEDGIKICKDYHIQMPVQSAFIGWRQEPDEYLEKILGKERNEALNPLATFLANDIKVAFGSDAPCTDPDPIVWLDKAVNHSVASERISIEDALRMSTINGYAATFDDDKRGSLEVGKVADMVILSANPYKVGNENIKNLKVEKLILAGKDYESAKKGFVSTVIKGLTSNNKY